MDKLQEAIDRVSDYLGNRVSLDLFEDWSAGYMQSVYRSDNADAQSLAASLRAILNAFEDDTSEDGLRQELANAIYPFVHLASNRYGAPSSAAESNAKFDLIVAA
ncbi:MAG TPA: hypothetical protein VME17_19105 [Bryobacteraceae bacterium]|nr:hypothetical protein [Bryobacteraceae bacterium]